MIVTVRSGHGIRTNYLAGYLPRVAQVQTVQNSGYTLVSTRWPLAATLEQSCLIPSGFGGGISLVTSDVLLFLTRSRRYSTRGCGMTRWARFGAIKRRPWRHKNWRPVPRC